MSLCIFACLWTLLSTPLISAHRGGAMHAPENTKSAFENAAKLSVSFIEFDVHLTKDRNVVVVHDQVLYRTTLLDFSQNVQYTRLADLQKIDVGSYFSPFYSFERIMTLEKLFEIVDPKIGLMIEIKKGSSSSYRLALEVNQVVSNYQDRKILISSFSSEILHWIHILNPNLSIMSLVDKIEDLESHASIPFDQLGAPPELIPFLRAQYPKTPLWVYTINDEDTMRKMTEIGVYGIITDDPKKALLLKSSYGQIE